MVARRRIELDAGSQAVRAWIEAHDAPATRAHSTGAAGDCTPVPAQPTGIVDAPADRARRRRTTATAVRFCLEELAACAPGRAVEVRVPPYGATQAVAGTTHRRGTPPSVVETDPETWLALATGMMTWEEALATGALHASGERCDLSPYLPLMPGYGPR